MAKGSLTIELTILMPFILGVFLFILFSGFVMHDKCIVNKACLSAALRGSEESEDAEAITRAQEAIAEVLPGHLIGKWVYDTNVDIGTDEVRVTFTGSAQMGSGLIRRVLGAGNTDHSYECRSCRLKEAEYMRENKKKWIR
jgi:Flp pilus assembly protein TadG